MIYTQQNTDTVAGTTTLVTWDLSLGTMTVEVEGVVTEERPMTPEEIAAWQEHTAVELGSTEMMVQGLLREYATAQDPETASDWIAPTGAHDAYMPGAIVVYNNKKWRNDLMAVNVWAPGTQNAGWTDLTPPVAGPPAWVQPTGAHDAYNVGDHVTHNSQTWVSTAAANVWEPGVYGWSVV
jgi:hypothetical protein